MDASTDHPLQHQTTSEKIFLPPPRLVVFQPDGKIDLAVDPKRPPPPPSTPSSTTIADLIHGNLPTIAISPSTRNAIFPTEYEQWSRQLHQQKILLYIILVIDLLYLLSLLIIRAIWTTQDYSDSDSNESSAAVFFISKPSELSMAFIIAALLTDVLVAIFYDRPPVITLFIIWSLLLAGFCIGRLPLFFIIIRVIILLVSIQWRVSMGRVNTLQPPVDIVGRVRAQFGRWRPTTTTSEEINIEEGTQVPNERNTAAAAAASDDGDENRANATALYIEETDPGFVVQWARAASNRRVAETTNQVATLYPFITPLITVIEPYDELEEEKTERRRSTDGD